MTDLKSIFGNALAIPSPADREAYLNQACAGNAALRAEVQALLEASAEAGHFLEPPRPRPVATVDEASFAASPGTVIGPYKLVQQIGEGGMGTVWMAQQTEPVKRLVALKLIKSGMDSKQVIARFEAERQALALMDHPHIAKVLDAGTTSAGRPYFVMDLVKGVPITNYCDTHRLTPRQRLELFIPVCQAIQHAHQKGIIHRDLKPSNVLVALYDGKPVPKVIDFGVAKAAGQTLTDKTLVTGFGGIVGTLEYMAPEQAEINQLDIDTRSDIYSLGVLLYELLTGSPPFTRKELEKAGMLEMLRVIREQEPSKPSTKLSTAEGLPTLAASRGTEPAKLTKLVRGELDWIVMKALEKDRNRRYETANGFAMDVQRYLSDEHVLACPPSALYRFRKFARRNRVALTTAVVVAAALVLGILGTTWQAYRATAAEKLAVAEQLTAQRERDSADDARKDAELARDEEKKLREQEKKLREEAERQKKLAEENFAKARKAVDDYFTAVSESQLLKVSGMQVLRRELLLSAMSFYEQFLKERGDDPSIRAGVASAQLRVGKIMQELGDNVRAREALGAAQATYEAALLDSPKDLELKAGLAECWYLVGNYDKSIALREELLLAQPANARFKRDLADSFNMRGLTFVRAKKPPEETLAAYRRCVELRMELARDYPRDPYVQHSVFNSFNNIGAELSRTKHPQQALDMYLQANQYGLAACALLPHSIDFSKSLAVGLHNVGQSLWTLGRKEESLREFQKAADRLKVLAQDNPAVPSVLSAYVRALQELSTKQRALGQTEEAARSLRLMRGFVERMPRQTPDEIYDLACYRAICAGLVGHGQEKRSAEEEAERHELADRAMEALQQAVAKGYADAAHMKADEDLAALRPRDDFQKLLTRLESEAQVDVLAKGVKGTTEQQMRAQAELAALLQKLTADDPKNLRHRATLATSRQAIGLWEMEIGKVDDAARSLEQAAALREGLVKDDPTNPEHQAELAACLVNLGQLDWKAGRLAAATRMWGRGLTLLDFAVRGESATAELRAKASQAEQDVAAAYMEMGLFAEAARLYGLAFEHHPPTVANRWRTYAWVQFLVGDQEGYRKTCAAMNERFGTSKVPTETHLLAAACLIAPETYGDPLHWLAVSEKVAKGDPKATWLEQYVIQAHYRAGQYQEANKVIGLRSWGPANSPLLAMTYHRLGQAAQARAFLKRADEWYADTMRTNLTGDMKLILGTTDLLTRVMFLILHREAKALIEGAAPPDTWQQLWQGRMYTLLGQNSKALANFQAAVVARPNDPDVWIARAQVYASLGDHVKAEEDFAQAIAVKPEDARPRIARGRYFAERGEHTKADADFTKAAALTPNELNRFIEDGWWVAGPYPYDLKRACPPESETDPSKPAAPLVVFPTVPLGSSVDGFNILTSLAGAQYPWKACATEIWGTVKRGHPTLEKPGGPVSVYGLTYVYSPDERPATLLIGGDLMRLWLNGRLVHEGVNIFNSPLTMERVPIALQPGKNTLLINARDRDGGFWFRVRLADNPVDRGFVLAEVGLWKEAAAAFARRLSPELSESHFCMYCSALAHLQSGSVEAYGRLATTMLEQHGSESGSLDLLRTCTLSPLGAAETARLLRIAETVHGANPKHNWNVMNLGMAHYRASQLEPALRHMEQALAMGDWGVFYPALAMAHHRLGQADKAREWLQKADQFAALHRQQALDQFPFTLARPGLHWADWTYFEILWREAKQLIEGKLPTDDPAWFAVLRARAWAELRESANAHAEFDLAVKLSPNNEAIRKARDAYLRGADKFVVLDQGGAVQRKFDSLAGAIAGAAADETIEIRGNGPFVTGPLKVTRPLTIRAGSGFRPVIQLSPEGIKVRADLLVNQAPLLLEGLDLQIVPEGVYEQNGAHHAIIQSRAPVHVANCRLLSMQLGQPVINLGPICQFRNCEVLVPGGHRISTYYKPHLLMSVDNCCVMGGVGLSYHQVGDTDYTQESTIRLTRNTIVSPYLGFLLNTCADKVPGLWTDQQRVRPVRLASEGNIWDTRFALMVLQQAPPGKILAPDEAETSLPQVLSWHGARNLYVGEGEFLRLAVIPGQYPASVNPIKSVADWGKYWGAAEPGSIEGKTRYQGGDLLDRLKSEPEKITAEDFRLLPDSAGFKDGKDGKDLGADIDFVGPGAAYERWKKTQEYQQWLKDTAQRK